MSNSIADEIFDTFLIVSGMHLLSLEDKTFCISVLLGVHADEDSCFFRLDKTFSLFNLFTSTGVVFVFKHVNASIISCVKSIWF